MEKICSCGNQFYGLPRFCRNCITKDNQEYKIKFLRIFNVFPGDEIWSKYLDWLYFVPGAIHPKNYIN